MASRHHIVRRTHVLNSNFPAGVHHPVHHPCVLRWLIRHFPLRVKWCRRIAVQVSALADDIHLPTPVYTQAIADNIE